tara:strand:- start:262 stop:1623 length:1362 start_codon:yes stop_codon:yes gene_type:complete
MALPNLSTLSLEVVDTEADEEDVFEFNEQVDQDDPFSLHHDAWTGPPMRRGPVRRNRKSLGMRKKEVDPLPRVHEPPDADEPNATIPNDYLANPGYFEDERRKEKKWGFLFRQQRYSFRSSGERDSTHLPERIQLKERFERKDGLANTCRRTMWRGQEAEVYKRTTGQAVFELKKAIENWHSLCYVVNGRDDVLGIMALGQLNRSVVGGDVSVSNHQMKLPSEWINGMRTLIRQKGIHRPLGDRAKGQSNYTPKERFREVQKRNLDFYIEWVCTASDEGVKNLPDNLKVKGVGTELLDGLMRFVREVYIDPCARAFLVEQWSLPDIDVQFEIYDPFGRMEPWDEYKPNEPSKSTPRAESQSVSQGLAWAKSQIELWAFFDFIALTTAKGAWKKMGFCQTGGTFKPWDEKLELLGSRDYFTGVPMFMPLVGFAADYECEDDGRGAPPPPRPSQP